jgi:hypothetical protein
MSVGVLWEEAVGLAIHPLTRIFAVYFGRAQENEAAHCTGSGLTESNRRVDVDAPDLRFRDAGTVRDRCKVYDDVHVFKERTPVEFGGNVLDRDLLQFRQSGARLTCPPDRRADRVPTRDELPAKNRADKTGCTGDENAHDE